MAAQDTRSKWKPSHPVDIFIYAKQGMSDTDIAKTLGAHITSFNNWRKVHPECQYALDKARNSVANGGTPQTLAEYVYQKLPADLQVLWDKIAYLEDMDGGLEKVELLLSSQPTEIRQLLFIHALSSTAFNVSRAMSMVCVTRSDVHKWTQTDPHFVELMNEIQFHKKNFFEQALVDLVTLRSPMAVIHVNKTLNKDRGYGESIKVEGEITHIHRIVPVAKLNLPLETLIEMEKTMQALEAETVAAAAVPKQLSNGKSAA